MFYIENFFFKSPCICFPNEILKVFWDGLKMDIQKFTVSASPKDMKEALEIAGKADKVLVGSEVIKEIKKVTELYANTNRAKKL